MKRILSSSIVVKVLALLLLLFLANIPLSKIEGIIGERGAMKQSAASELASSYASSQTLVGPILVVPWTERWTDITRDGKGVIVDRTSHSRSHVQLMYPDRMRVNGDLTPDKRHRGIFTVLFYGFKGTMAGQFPAIDPATLRADIEGSAIEIGTPVLAFSMSDLRGLQGAPGLVIAGEGAAFLPRAPGLPESWPFQSVHAPLPAAALKAWSSRQPMDFTLDLALTGQSKLGIVPIAGDTTAHIGSTWPHPSFGGSFLATHRESVNGFEADWRVSSLASGARGQLTRLAASDKAQGGVETFAVSLIDPLDVYALTGRAVKYGMLFVALTLMAAFMFELMRNLKLHPVQYGLVGLAITLFFLLLLALSEKIAFGLAYSIATGACVLLLIVYFSAVLGHWRRGLALGAYVGVLYAALYGLLLSEDNALLLGSVLLFGLLALMMIATRKVDWYALSAPTPSAATGQ